MEWLGGWLKIRSAASSSLRQKWKIVGEIFLAMMAIAPIAIIAGKCHHRRDRHHCREMPSSARSPSLPGNAIIGAIAIIARDVPAERLYDGEWGMGNGEWGWEMGMA
jgi:hypothetical protein